MFLTVEGFQIFGRLLVTIKAINSFLHRAAAQMTPVTASAMSPPHQCLPTLTLKDNLERLQEQLNLKAFSIFSLFSKSPKISVLTVLAFGR